MSTVVELVLQAVPEGATLIVSIGAPTSRAAATVAATSWTRTIAASQKVRGFVSQLALNGGSNLKLEGDAALGVKIVRAALTSPLRQIAENAGEIGAVVVRRVMESKDNEGFNALTGEYVDMFKAGIITPTKVERIALQNAAEVAILMLTTDCIVVEKPKSKDDHGGHDHGGGMGGGMGGMGMGGMGGMGGMDDMM